METLGLGWTTESMSLAVGFTLMKNIHLMFFVPSYHLFHTHSFHITKIQNKYLHYNKDTPIALKLKDTNHDDPRSRTYGYISR